MKHALLVGLVAAFASTSSASAGDTSFTDPPGDVSEAPDITAVTISDMPEGQLTIHVEVADIAVLPEDTRITLRFDLDNDPGTGAVGYEAAAQYSSDGELSYFRFDGDDLIPSPSVGMSADFSAGVLTYTLEQRRLESTTSFGLVAVASRVERLGKATMLSSDYAPSAGKSVYTAPGEMTFPDPRGDRDAAPDIRSIDVSDGQSGWITFRVTAPNYQTLPHDKLIGISVHLAGRAASSDEVFVGYLGSGIVELDREKDDWISPVEPPFRIRGSYTGGQLTLSIHRSELDYAARFRFAVGAGDLLGIGPEESDEENSSIEALDVAPDGHPDGELFSYRLASPPPVRLLLGTVTSFPAHPQAGEPFTFTVDVHRSDTWRLVRSGSVACSVFAGTKRLPAAGRFRGGRAQCGVRVPRAEGPIQLHGTIAIRAAGASVRSRFAFAGRQAP